jgi:hypothetical protein
MQLDVAIHPDSEAVIDVAGRLVDQWVRLDRARIRRMVDEILIDAVASEPARHLTARAEQAERHTRTVVFGLDVRLGVSRPP